MKIVYDYQIFSSQKYGGISKYIYQLITQIARFQQDEVNVIAGLYVNQYLKECHNNLVIGWQRPSIPKTVTISKFINYNLSKIWLSTYGNPDIVHETYYSLQSIAPKSSKTILTVHDMIHEKFASLFPEKQKRWVSIKAKAVERADRIICVSNQTKEDLIEILNVNPQKITVIYHGCNSSISNSFDSNLSSKKLPYILYVGVREAYKNFDRLLQAYAKHPQLNNNFKLICVGASNFSREELERINNVGLNENKVQYISGDDRTLAELYRQASVFVYPSLYEGFGMPLLEAMSFDCPVACSNTSSLPEVAENAAEFFDPYEVDSIAEALENILFSSEKSKKLIISGRKRLKNFSWETCARKTRSVYSSLL